MALSELRERAVTVNEKTRKEKDWKEREVFGDRWTSRATCNGILSLAPDQNSARDDFESISHACFLATMDQTLARRTLQELIKREDLKNRLCVDCGNPNPQWASLRFAQFIPFRRPF